MQIKGQAAAIAVFLNICDICTCALITERLFVRDVHFDGYSCTSGDTVKTFEKIRSKIACIASCVESGCLDVFYFPGTNMCQGCYTFHSNDLKPAVSPETSLHYKPVLKCLGSFVRYNTSCYMVTDTRMIWDTAKDYCVSVNAHLAIIDDLEENSFIENYLDSKGVGSLDDRIFFGLTDSQEEDKWLTVHGNIQSFVHWTPGQPDETPSLKQDCATINMGTTLKTWNDTPCSYKYLAICEMELI